MIFKQRKAWGAALVLALSAATSVAHASSSTVTVASTAGGSILTASASNSTAWVFTLGSDITSAVTFAASAKSGGSSVLMSQLTLSGPSLSTTGTLTQLPGGKSLFLKFNSGLLAGTYTLNLGAAGNGPDDYKVVTNLMPTTLGNVTAVPEGDAWALALAGAGLVGLRMSRRRGVTLS